VVQYLSSVYKFCLDKLLYKYLYEKKSKQIEFIF